jgi:protein involved in polysaccharide export with SLBB domain
VFVALLAAVTAIGLTAAPPPSEAVHPGDKIMVTVFNHPELSSPSVTVDAAGSISIPLAGAVDARGASTRVVAERIRSQLHPYVPLAAVDVRLLEQGTEIFVAGDRGGVLKYSPGETLVAALQDVRPNSAANPAAGGGDLRHGPIDLHDVQIVRDGATLGPYDVDALISHGDPGPALFPGDTLRLRDKPIRVAVLGDVKVPGSAYVDRGAPLLQTISEAGGALDTAWTTHIQLTRAGATRALALGDPAFSEPAQDGDVLVIPRAPTVSVLGMVVKPGSTVLRNDASLLDALYEAGGPQRNGNLKSVAVLHHGERTEYDITKLTHGAHNENPHLADGDTVFVPEGHKIDFGLFFQALTGAWMLKQLTL